MRKVFMLTSNGMLLQLFVTLILTDLYLMATVKDILLLHKWTAAVDTHQLM